MSDFLAAIGLVLVFEGLVYGGFPHLAKHLAKQVDITAVRICKDLEHAGPATAPNNNVFVLGVRQH